MKVKLRARAGGLPQLSDENGKEIEGLVDFHLNECRSGSVPTLTVIMRAEFLLDVEATVETAPLPAADAAGDGGPAAE